MQSPAGHTEATRARQARPRLPRACRVFAALAVLAAAGTVLAAQVDYARRHELGISAARYLEPQILQIWLPGFGCAAVLAAAAWLTARRSRTRAPAGEAHDRGSR